MRFQFLTNSPQETFELGESIGRKLKANSVLAFYGDLAAGKTTLIKGIANVQPGISSNDVNSPTFNYLNIYEGLSSLYHFDLYRLKSNHFLEMGFDEYFTAKGICLIEWAEQIRAYLPKRRFDIYLNHKGDSREIVIESKYEKISF